MADPGDYYKVLQVASDADAGVIRAAYRTLARKNHPDLGGGSTARMAAINNAWNVLRDPLRRAEYDRRRMPSRPQEPIVTPATPPATARAAVATPRPPGQPSGSVIDFGRYEGWSLGELARHDPDFLEWFARVPIGRRFRAEIDALMATRTRATTAVAEGPRRSRFRRR